MMIQSDAAAHNAIALAVDQLRKSENKWTASQIAGFLIDELVESIGCSNDAKEDRLKQYKAILWTCNDRAQSLKDTIEEMSE